jgi:hypothetical protein
MNSICTQQNSERQIQRLAAQRQLYATAKTVFGWHAVASGPVAVALAFAVFMHADLKGYAALWGIALTIADVAWLTPWQKRLRSAGAGIQEAFDCDVLELSWNTLKAGKKPDPERVREQANKYSARQHRMPSLQNWYPQSACALPIHVGRLICQRSNCWWDANQRRRYAVVVGACVAVILICLLGVAMTANMTVPNFVVGVAAPIAPAVLLGYRQYVEQMEAVKRIDNLKEHAERLWTAALQGESPRRATEGSRGLQDEILENRRRSPLVFDAVFKRLRSAFDRQMNHAADELALEARQKLRL